MPCHKSHMSQYHFKSIVYSNANFRCYDNLNAKWKSQKKLRNGKVKFMRWHRVYKKCWDVETTFVKIINALFHDDHNITSNMYIPMQIFNVMSSWKPMSQYHFKSIVYSNANIQCYDILNAKWYSQKKLRNLKAKIYAMAKSIQEVLRPN